MATPTFILPSAPTYTEGFVNGLNVYPDPTNFIANQVPFTRATTATRTNAAGLIELVPYNLVPWSEQLDNAAWVKLNASITANTTTAPNGTLTADKVIPNTISGIHNVSQSLTFTASTTCTTSVYAKKAEYSALRINYISSANTFVSVNLDTGVIANAGGAIYLSSSITDVGDGWYRITMTFTPPIGSSSLNFIVENPVGTVSFTGDGTSGLYLWGAQLVEGTDALPYQLTETRLNRPRVDFSLGGCPNLLLEPQRTNLMLRSEEFDNATWTKGSSSISANTTTAPSGFLTADTFTANGTSNLHNINQSVSVTSGVAYTMSIYAKKDTNNFIQFSASATIFSTNTFANFDLNNGVVGSVGSAATATITNVGNGWYRCTMTATATATATNLIIVSLVTSETSPRNEINTLSTSVFLWGAQFELGAFPTTYIPTSSASVTRNTDTFQLSNVFTNNLISSAGGTWFVELKNNLIVSRDLSSGGIFINTGTNSTAGDGFSLRNSLSTGRTNINKVVGGVTATLFTTTTDTIKVAIKWNGTTADVFLNGVKVVASNSFTATAMENLIGSGANVTFNLNSMALYNTPISDAECIQITTL
jgi:hypothetical protein